VTPRPSQLQAWPRPFDPAVELDWGDPVVSKRLLREHLDQSHDGASRREPVIDGHVRRLARLLPPPPARILDAASGPGLYAVRLAAAGHDVTALDIGPAVVAHARRLAREQGLASRVSARVDDLRSLADSDRFDAALLGELPTGVDPCAENGEFHTFACAGPMPISPSVTVTAPPPAVPETLSRARSSCIFCMRAWSWRDCLRPRFTAPWTWRRRSAASAGRG